MLSSRTYYGKLQYLVQWKGWDPDPTWYNAENFKNSAHQLKQYHEANPDKAGPPVRLEQWLKAAEGDEYDEPHEDDNKGVVVGVPLRRSVRKKK